jgi:hypothetical protein
MNPAHGRATLIASTSRPSVHLRIGRLTVDARALGEMRCEQLVSELRSSLAQSMSGTTVPAVQTLAQRIAGTVARRVHACVPAPLQARAQ